MKHYICISNYFPDFDGLIIIHKKFMLAKNLLLDYSVLCLNTTPKCIYIYRCIQMYTYVHMCICIYTAQHSCRPNRTKDCFLIGF